MISIPSKTRGAGMSTALGLATALLMSLGGTALAQSSDAMSKHSLAGTWFVRVTLRDCTTRAPFGAFNSLVTFHRGGTLSESMSSPGAVGQRGPGSGNWALEEDHTFSQRLVALMNFDTPANLPGTPGFDPTLPVSPAFFAGWSTVSQTVTLTNADGARSSGTNTFFKADGTPYASGCSTALLTRFE